jgi:hypothetical protein
MRAVRLVVMLLVILIVTLVRKGEKYVAQTIDIGQLIENAMRK